MLKPSLQIKFISGSISSKNFQRDLIRSTMVTMTPSRVERVSAEPSFSIKVILACLLACTTLVSPRSPFSESLPVINSHGFLLHSTGDDSRMRSTK